MGNSQSTIVDLDTQRKRSHRLSKPKTGNHATSGLLSPGGFSNSSKRHSKARMSFLPPPPSPASTPTTASTFDAQPGPEPQQNQYMERSASAVSVQRNESKRRSLFRSRSSQGSPDRERRQSSIGPFSRVADRLSRTNSMTYESALSYYGPQPVTESWQPPPAGSRTSWNYDMSSYEAKRLLNFTEEPRFELAATMSENKMTVVTETTWKSSNPAQPTNPPSTTISRANSDLSLYMPVRRRSVIQKPGVATRANSLRDGPNSRPNFRFSHPPTPNMSRQPSVESFRGGVLSMPPAIHDPEVQRAVTPCEDDYHTTGAFKLGSLRIVNGAASPGSPEVEKSRVRVDRSQGFSSKHADYFTAAQKVQPGDTNIEQPGAPHIASLAVEAPQSRAIPLSPINTSFLNLDTPSIASGPASTKLAAAVPVVPDYLADISFSPFSLEKPLPTSPKLETTSKTAALDDHLFEDEPSVDYSSPEVLDVREDANAKPKSERSDGDAGSKISRTDSGFESARSPSEYSHKPLAKADSGYSSNVSLRSFQAKAQEKELTLSLTKQSSHSSRGGVSIQSEERRSLSFVSAMSHPIPPEREAPPPPVPPKDYLQVSPTQSKSSVSTKKSNTATDVPKPGANARAPVPPTINLPARSSGPKSPESMPRTPGSARSAKSDRSNSALSIGSGSHKPSKLHRLLSTARRPAAGPPTVHETHVEEKAKIPAAPREVEHKFQEHTGLFPLTTKRLALKPRASLDTLKTIFSVGSVEASYEAANSIPPAAKVPEAVAEEDHEAKEPGWRHTLQAVPASIANAAAHVIPRKPVPRRISSEQKISVKDRGSEPPQKSSSPDSILVAEAELSTYTSISNSLGNNAYDVALIAMASGDNGPLSPQIVSRTLTLNESAMRRLELGSPSSSTKSPFNLPSPAPPSPLMARNASMVDKAKSPPPVSMATRRPMSLRVPQPLRSQSSTERLSRQNSRENIQSYPAAQPPLARKPSRDSVRSYPAYPQLPNSASERSDPSPPIPPMDPRRIMAFRQSQYTNYQVQSWETQTEHDYSGRASRSNSMVGHSRNNSVSSAPGGHPGYGIQRPESAQSWQVYSAKPQLRHRSSYDSFNLQQRRSQYGHPAAMSNGYTAPKSVYDPWNSKGQFDPGAGLGLQDSRYPPYVPRGHHRNRSISRANPNAPYRVLHSYNSPAYRNAPIWG